MPSFGASFAQGLASGAQGFMQGQERARLAKEKADARNLQLQQMGYDPVTGQKTELTKSKEELALEQNRAEVAKLHNQQVKFRMYQGINNFIDSNYDVDEFNAVLENDEKLRNLLGIVNLRPMSDEELAKYSALANRFEVGNLEQTSQQVAEQDPLASARLNNRRFFIGIDRNGHKIPVDSLELASKTGWFNEASKKAKEEFLKNQKMYAPSEVQKMITEREQYTPGSEEYGFMTKGIEKKTAEARPFATEEARQGEIGTRAKVRSTFGNLADLDITKELTEEEQSLIDTMATYEDGFSAAQKDTLDLLASLSSAASRVDADTLEKVSGFVDSFKEKFKEWTGIGAKAQEFLTVQGLANVRNTALKIASGAAVTTGEADRFIEAFGKLSKSDLVNATGFLGEIENNIDKLQSIRSSSPAKFMQNAKARDTLKSLVTIKAKMEAKIAEMEGPKAPKVETPKVDKKTEEVMKGLGL